MEKGEGKSSMQHDSTAYFSPLSSPFSIYSEVESKPYLNPELG